MRYFILILMCLFLSSCGDYYENTSTIYESGFKGMYYKHIVIDGCEYIIGRDNLPYNGGYFMTHKGNCTNKIHIYNK
jgi:hypothetical protein